MNIDNICSYAYAVNMQSIDASSPPRNAPTPAGESAQRVNADLVRAHLMALPLAALLRYWQRLTWWTGMWPLFRQMAAVDLRLPEIMVLRILVRRSLNVAEVADCIALSQSAASRAVDRLVADGLISRQEDPHDRRNKRLTLTPAGVARIEEIEQVYGGEFGSLVAELSPAEQEELQALFAHLLAAFVARHEDEEEYVAWARELGGVTSEEAP
jgi:DNA-binding MarR family transcriptional regulator